MAKNETVCPVCNADIPLAGDEKAGEEVFCGSCGAPCKLRGGGEDEELQAEEDF